MTKSWAVLIKSSVFLSSCVLPSAHLSWEMGWGSMRYSVLYMYLYCDGTGHTTWPASSCSAASFWQFQLFIYSNCIQTTVTTESYLEGRIISLVDHCRLSGCNSEASACIFYTCMWPASSEPEPFTFAQSILVDSLKGPKREIFVDGIFAQIRPIWLGYLVTRPKNPKKLRLGLILPFISRDFCFNAVGDSTKRKKILS